MKTTCDDHRDAPKFHTTAAYISGGICGRLWWPVGVPGGEHIYANIRPVIARFSDPDRTTFRDVLDVVLTEHGGDYQHARFTADTVIRVERRAITPTGDTVHVFEREILTWFNADCADYVDPSTFTSDLFSEE